MTQVIEHKLFSNYLNKTKPKDFPCVCLIFGDEFLSKTILKEVLDKLLPGDAKKHNYEPIDGNQGDGVFSALEHVNTYSMLAETKVVALLDSQIFYSKQDESKLIGKIASEYTKDNIKKAAILFLSLLGFHELDLSDVSREIYPKLLGKDAASTLDEKAMDHIYEYCQEEKLVVAPKLDIAQSLSDAVLKGFPKGNHLLIITDLVDKRRGLFKAIKEKGVIVDCSVPMGERSADKKAQRMILSEKLGDILKLHKKKIAPDATHTLFDLSGFDIRNFSNNVLKLIDYIGGSETITVKDIHSVLKRNKKDPIFELTSAISDRNPEKSLFFIKSLLDNEVHPLAILTAIVNQIRKLLVAKSFLQNSAGNNWQRGMPFEHFKNSTLQFAVAHDKKRLEQLQNWPEDGLIRAKGKKKIQKSSAGKTDLLLAKNPKNAYPIYQTFLKTDNYKQQELIDAYHLLSDTDFHLKRTGLNHRLILENAVIQICSSSPNT